MVVAYFLPYLPRRLAQYRDVTLSLQAQPNFCSVLSALLRSTKRFSRNDRLGLYLTYSARSSCSSFLAYFSSRLGISFTLSCPGSFVHLLFARPAAYLIVIVAACLVISVSRAAIASSADPSSPPFSFKSHTRTAATLPRFSPRA
eukprot:g54891.t1